MKFKLKQEKFEELLEKLALNNLYPSSVISVRKAKDGTNPILFSIQREIHGRAMRCLRVNHTYFTEIEDSNDSIEIDVIKLLAVVKKMRSGTDLTVETVNNKVKVGGVYERTDADGKVTSSRKFSAHVSYKEPDKEIVSDMPFTMKDGVPLVGEKKVPLGIKFEINLEDFKEMTDSVSTVKSEFYKFVIKDGKLEVRAGDLHEYNDFWNYEVDYKIIDGGDLDVVMSFAVSEMSNTFRKNPTLQSKSQAPTWLFEKTDDYMFGVLIPPYIPGEDEIQ